MEENKTVEQRQWTKVVDKVARFARKGDRQMLFEPIWSRFSLPLPADEADFMVRLSQMTDPDFHDAVVALYEEMDALTNPHIQLYSQIHTFPLLPPTILLAGEVEVGSARIYVTSTSDPRLTHMEWVSDYRIGRNATDVFDVWRHGWILDLGNQGQVLISRSMAEFQKLLDALRKREGLSALGASEHAHETWLKAFKCLPRAPRVKKGPSFDVTVVPVARMIANQKERIVEAPVMRVTGRAPSKASFRQSGKQRGLLIADQSVTLHCDEIGQVWRITLRRTMTEAMLSDVIAQLCAVAYG